MRSRCNRWFGVAPLAVLMVLVLGGASASAALLHPLLSSFTGSGTPEGAMRPLQLAVDNSSGASAGHVYVGAFSAHVVNEFSAAGGYLCQITGAGSASTSPSECDTSGAGPEGALGSPEIRTAVAVDASGHVYVGNMEHHAVDVFSPSGAYLSEIPLPNEATPNALAVDAAGDILIAAVTPAGEGGIPPPRGTVYKFIPGAGTLDTFATEGPGGRLPQLAGVASDNDPSSSSYGYVYVVQGAGDRVLVYDATGAYITAISGTPSGPFPEQPEGVAVDPASGDLYVASGSGVDEFAPGGAFLSHITLANGWSPYAVAINASSHDLYVSDGFGTQTVYVFGPAVLVPTVGTAAPVNVSPTGVTLHGSVDPAGGGEVSGCVFEWGETASYGNTAPCSPAPGYASPAEVDSAPITGLTPDTAYHFRLSATNANGTEHSPDGTLETTGKPTIEEEGTVVARQTAATVQAKLNAHGFATTYKVEYGLCAATCPATYEAVAPEAGAGSGVTAAVVSREITGLQRNAEYHYRFVATSSQGTTDAPEAPDPTFKTAAGATAEYRSATAGPHNAEILASIDPAGEAATCRVEYVSEAEYTATQYTGARSLACSPSELAADAGARTVHVKVGGLAIDTVYHYRFILASASGEATALEGTVATFGIDAFAFEMQDGSGNPYTQAGGHPDSVTTNIVFAQTDNFLPSGNVKDVRVELPPGFIGNPSATPACTRGESERFRCSGASQVGTITVQASASSFVEPLFNLVPPKGVAAELGARFNNFANAFIDAKVRTGGDYGVDGESLNITNLAGIKQVTVKLWGVPGATSHDGERACPNPTPGQVYESPCAAPERGPAKPFLTAPGSCSGAALQSTVFADAYQAPGEFVTSHTETPAMEGCEKLSFSPSLSVQPQTHAADSPTGLQVDLHVPQNNDPTGVSSADLKNATVTFPAGLAVNPSAADGLGACSEEQVGFTGFKELNGASEAGVQTAQFTPGAAECPDSSKLGDVEIDTPLLAHQLLGALYLAEQGANPFGSMIAVYLTVDDPISGVIVKLPGLVRADPQTGQLTATFEQNPQLPFEDLKVNLFGGSGGSRVSLTTPFTCGSYATSSVLRPWSSPEGKDESPSSPAFEIAEAPGGGACVSSEAQAPNSPGFTAGTASPVAGSYSPFVLKLSREDGSQRFGALNVTLAPGLTGKIAGIEQCPQADIEKAQSRGHEGEGALEQSNPSCPSGSAVGVVHVGAGSGAPYYVAGKAYFAGPYNGAPFSLVIVTPAVAGPFDLGTVVVRAGLFIDPSTAQVTVRSDPFPSILDGIPLDIRSVAVEMNRSDFVLNPTSCNVMSVTGEEKSTSGNVASLSSRFQAGGCTTLPFSPSFTASTQGKAGRADGASLVVKVDPLPGQANIAKVDLQLPKQLPSRLKTLQKACTAAVFEANPAACPAASNIGTGTASTPLLSAPLTGPAYLVSRGGAAFPDIEFVLQAYERGGTVEIVLDGKTQIKNGVTYSHFETVPDAPITSFETVFPQGPYSILGTNLPQSAKSSLCGQSLTIPTTLTGQNGAVVTQKTKIRVTGCPKVVKKALTRAQKLKAALKACRTKDKGKAKRRQRETCEKAAQKRYGPQKKGKQRKAGKGRRGK